MEKEMYIVRKYRATIKDKHFSYSNGCTMDYDLKKFGAADPEEIFRSGSKDEALAELAKHRSYAKQDSFSAKEWDVCEYWADEEIWDFEESEEPIFVELAGAEAFAACDIM